MKGENQSCIIATLARRRSYLLFKLMDLIIAKRKTQLASWALELAFWMEKVCEPWAKYAKVTKDQ